MSTPRYCFGLEGSAQFIRAAADAQGEVMEPFFDGTDWEYSPDYFHDIPALHQQRRPTAFGGLEVFGIVLGFIGTCFAKKIFDEVYERTLKRPIAIQLDKFFSKISVPAGKAVEYRDIIYLEDIDLVVVIRALVEKEATQELQSQVMQAHRIAHSYIEQHGRKAPIHCHKIANGLVSLEPELFSTMEEIKQHDRAQLKIPPRK
jgi:hypothetical protein